MAKQRRIELRECQCTECDGGKCGVVTDVAGLSQYEKEHPKCAACVRGEHRVHA